MRSDNVASWNEYHRDEWARITADPIVWSWSCPRCPASMPRAEVADHVAAHDAEPPRGIVTGLLLGLAMWALLGVVVWRLVR